MTPDLIYDQLIGAGCARRLTFSWGGNPGVGSLHRLRDAVEQGWPRALEIDEQTHAGMAAAYRAGAARLPFGMLRGYIGTDLVQHNPRIRKVTCPYTGEDIATVPAINPDVTILHAQRADRAGNVAIDGIIGAAREAALAARKLLVTVEQVVDALPPAMRPADPSQLSLVLNDIQNVMAGNVPLGAGLSSSAAVEMAAAMSGSDSWPSLQLE